jgi:myo-inositol-1-phosphate synthase
MNEIVVLPGIYQSSFLGETQHATATHIVTTTSSSNWFEQVLHLRNDIRTFIQQNDVNGHTTVIWSASVERPADVNFRNADELLETILANKECDISPSMLYAVAAALEGCSFVNGGSQNTLSPAMSQLYETEYRSTSKSSSSSSSSIWSKFTNVVTTPCYILGTDFKAGQTKFKTAAVEYIRCLGLKPRVIASSNHLGNNDMLNLTSKKTVEAKMRVKSDIFRPWQDDDDDDEPQQLDHQVRVMYTPFMLDEKRDVVEYTSLGWLHCPHTMLTYTRCMDSVLCVPLMVDAAVWCAYFARHESLSGTVARATAYLFKVPEGGAKGVDPGFQRQMQALELALQETSSSSSSSSTGQSGAAIHGHGYATLLERGIAAGIITQEQAQSLKGLE